MEFLTSATVLTQHLASKVIQILLNLDATWARPIKAFYSLAPTHCQDHVPLLESACPIQSFWRKHQVIPHCGEQRGDEMQEYCIFVSTPASGVTSHWNLDGVPPQDNWDCFGGFLVVRFQALYNIYNINWTTNVLMIFALCKTVKSSVGLR